MAEILMNDELPTREELASLNALIEQWDANERRLAELAELTSGANAIKAKIELDLIPSLMATAGNIERFDLADGRRVEIKPELYASISKANEAQAFSWLESNGHSAVIKDELKIGLGKGEKASECARALINTLEEMGVDDYSRKRGVHTGTLAALIREQLAEGVEVPKETFGVHQQRRAIIKLAKKV